MSAERRHSAAAAAEVAAASQSGELFFCFAAAFCGRVAPRHSFLRAWGGWRGRVTDLQQGSRRPRDGETAAARGRVCRVVRVLEPALPEAGAALVAVAAEDPHVAPFGLELAARLAARPRVGHNVVGAPLDHAALQLGVRMRAA
eukprot:3430167-Prymnesium_polylepis.1